MFEINQEVACKYANNMARYKDGYTKGKIVKIGRKYLTVQLENGNTIQFILPKNSDSDYLHQKSDYAGDYEMFPSVQDYLDYEEKRNLISDIRSAMGTIFEPKLSLDQLRRI